MRIFKFKSFCRFARKERISNDSLITAVDKIIEGNYDAKLGAFLYKQRVAREGKGTSTGYRVIVCLKIEDKAFFLYGFPKSVKDNISKSELAMFKEAAKYLVFLSEEVITTMLDNDSIEEIKKGD